ncbi:MAG: D-amino acid aminotransferase [Pseudomonadota bacterium]
MPIVYLNGAYLEEAQAAVPVTDRGFMFGDGVYEVIPAYGGKLFRLPEHLERLQNSLDAIRIRNPHPPAQWQRLLEELLERNHTRGGDWSVYLQVTRGVAPRDHAFPVGVAPTVFAATNPIKPPARNVLAEGVGAITVPDVRWAHCNIKAITLLPNILVRQQALDAGAAEAIMLRAGYLTEGAASNVFIVERGRVLTPPKSAQLLPGITRDVVLELARNRGMDCAEETISEAQLRQADEIWLTSSTREVTPVTHLDGHPVGNGAPGPLWAAMYEHFQAFKRSFHV